MSTITGFIACTRRGHEDNGPWQKLLLCIPWEHVGNISESGKARQLHFGHSVIIYLPLSQISDWERYSNSEGVDEVSFYLPRKLVEEKGLELYLDEQFLNFG